MKIHKLVFSPIEVNTYIISDESGDCAILDCGCYDKKETDKLGKFITGKNLKPVLLLNTHCHLDHIFGNNFILEKYGLRPFSSELDEMNRKNAMQHAMIFGLTMDNPPEPQGFIEDNQIVKFGANELLALHVPGHSPGSLAFYSRNDNCVFTGDALFAGSIGRTDLPGGDFNTLIKSIRNKLFVLPPSTVVYAGHGKETTIGNEIKSNPYFDD
jgi:glyoxylase-like metal-dependent hydrolase (beta-lactamase superfamily II)